MKYRYLNDSDFLKYLDLQRLKEQYIKITILDWNENPIQDLTGKALGGSINIDGSSNVRRTANINVFVPTVENNITNPNHLLSINKKVSIEIGFKNTTPYYKDYDMIWFPMGIYVIIQNSISHAIGGTNISLQLKDKMCLLNGECGGTLPASVMFNEIETIDSNGNPVITHPTLYQIIQEAVNHWGGEQLGKIIISDLDTRVKKVMKWIGSTPVYCFNEGNGVEFTTNENKIQQLEDKNIHITTDPAVVIAGNGYIKYENGRDIGYIYADFTYTGGDLVGEAGTSICDVLDQIKNILGNYEYFYDLDGNFVFQEIKNYLNTSHATVELENLENSDYLIDQSKGKTVYNFDDSTLITSYNNNPQFNMIKNDFIVWGQKTDANDKPWPIRYHVAIDTKPSVGKTHIVFQYKDLEDGLIKAKATINVDSVKDLPRPGNPGVFYFAKGSADIQLENGDKVYTKDQIEVCMQDAGSIYEWDPETQDYKQVPGNHLTEVTSKDWRTELYLQGVDSEPFGTDSNPYYIELQNEWPKLYNIWGENPNFYQEVKDTPSDCDFFLDFIDSTAAISEFSISNIGRRTKTLVDDKINCLFAPAIPDIVILSRANKTDEELAQERAECKARGQNYTQVDESIYSCLTGGGHLNSAYDAVRDLLYQYTSYNESISLQCVPIYHLDVNTRIGVADPESNISGDYIIHTISIPLDISSGMTISATKAVERF